MALDIVFISYHEPNAEKNWENLKERFPYALRVDGVTGIPEAFIEAARISKTSHVWTIDADNVVVDDFDFSFKPAEGEKDYVHLWYAENPVNGLAYGYGGIKLWPREFLRDAIVDPLSVDFTVPMAHNESAELKLWPSVASITSFNTDPYNSYRAGFREGAKLMDEILNFKVEMINYPQTSWTSPMVGYLKEAKQRLQTWETVGREKPHGMYCISGARDGREFAEKEVGADDSVLSQINDFEFIRERFIKRYGHEPVRR